MVSVIESWYTKDGLWSLAISPDDTCIGLGTSSGVRIRSTDTGRVLYDFLGESRYSVSSVAFSPDGRTIAAGSSEAIRIWDIELGRAATEPMRGHTDDVASVTFSPDGHVVISGSLDNTIRLWDTRTGQPIGRPIQAGSRVESVAISPDGKKIIGACGDHNIGAYDLSTSAKLFEGFGHRGRVTAVAFSRDGRRIVSGSSDGIVRIWNGATGVAIGEPLEKYGGHVTSATFSADGRYIAYGSSVGSIPIWDIRSRDLIADRWMDHDQGIVGIAFTADGKRMVSGSVDGALILWDTQGLGIRTESPNEDVPMEVQAPIMHTQDEITGMTTAEEIVRQLGIRGCANLTDQLDLQSCSEYPISSGGFGDIFRGKLKDATEVAIKTVRLYAGPSEQNQKHLKIGMIAEWESNGSMPQYLELHDEVDRCMMLVKTQCKGIIEGLSYLHASGVIHGDLKGVRIRAKANVLISKQGVPRLADFGNATLQEYTLQFTKSSTAEVLSARWAVKSSQIKA
ncbi:hypothetical protein FRC07_001465 [Ceratobasidium sp. 392]|nr:hypothetical protein FRC07_001465 [Ceratobasidium sp. 392]